MRYITRTTTEYCVVCEQCGRFGPWALSRPEAVELAWEEGWRFPGPGSTAVCPECWADFVGGERDAGG